MKFEASIAHVKEDGGPEGEGWRKNWDIWIRSADREKVQ